MLSATGRFCMYLLICISLLMNSPAAAAETEEFILSDQVLIQYDIYGVPHITASSDADLSFAQGYATARDRLWQMDYNRRLVQGTLAEVLGESSVEQDYEIRRLGLYRSAIATYNTLTDDMKKLAAAYAAGVNHYIELNKDRLPREFKELGYIPEPWHPIDSVAIPRMMFWHLSGSLEEELMLAKLTDEVGPEKALELVSNKPADPETHIKWRQAAALLPPDFGKDGFPVVTALEPLAPARGALRAIGSNNWVIDGKKSANGAPILANDPHLSLVNPPVWHEVHLMGPGINVIGSTFPGVAGVIIGHNEHIAWGVTNVGYDVCDLYIEKRDPDNPENYLYRGVSKPFQRATEAIRYRSGGSMQELVHDILYTVHGPVVDERNDSVISMRWTGHEPSTEFKFMYLLNRASNVAEFREALDYYQVGAQNFIYADIDGNIFYQPTGKVPIRNGAPFLPLDGSSGECEWQGYIPYQDLPRVLNPAEHFIATANARPVDSSYPYYIGYFFDIGYRVKRIKDLLSAKEKLTFEEVQAIQGDSYVLAAERLKPQLLAAIEAEKKLLPERTCNAAKLVQEWNNYSTTDTAACTIFNKWLERIAHNTLRDDLRRASFEYWASNPDIITVLLLRSATPGELKFDWFDNGKTRYHEVKNQIIAHSLQEAVEELSFAHGFEMEQWTWGKCHTVTLAHGLKQINKRYNNGPYPRRGCNDTVDNAGFSFFNGDFATGSGPSLRMTVELRPGVERAENVIPGGQSGDPQDLHYQDQLIDLWLRNKAHPMLFTKEQIEKNEEETLALVPTQALGNDAASPALDEDDLPEPAREADSPDPELDEEDAIEDDFMDEAGEDEDADFDIEQAPAAESEPLESDEAQEAIETELLKLDEPEETLEDVVSDTIEQEIKEEPAAAPASETIILEPSIAPSAETEPSSVDEAEEAPEDSAASPPPTDDAAAILPEQPAETAPAPAGDEGEVQPETAPAPSIDEDELKKEIAPDDVEEFDVDDEGELHQEDQPSSIIAEKEDSEPAGEVEEAAREIVDTSDFDDLKE